MVAFGLATNRPVGLPALSRSTRPPGGSGVSFVYPTARRAALLSNARSYRCMTNTGVSGAAAFTSASVGSRRSANWNSFHPPTTRTHCGGGVRLACSLSIRRASASDGTPSHRSSML
jgi:hypothetical protein